MMIIYLCLYKKVYDSPYIWTILITASRKIRKSANLPFKIEITYTDTNKCNNLEISHMFALGLNFVST